MNPVVKKNLLSFLGAIAIGVLIDYLIATTSGGMVANLGIISLIAGFSLLVFGAPHRNPSVGFYGWGALGLTVGIFAPFFLLLMLYAG